MALGDLDHRRLAEEGALAERAPGLGGDFVLLVPGAQLGLVKARVQLDLIDGRHRPGLTPQPLEVLDAEVGDADRPRPPFLVDPLEGPPGLDEEALRVGAGQWIR